MGRRPLTPDQRRASIRRRFNARLPPLHQRTPDGCWEWMGARTPLGYGQLSAGHGRPPLYAHRIAYELRHGPIPSRRFICHRCDNPPCVNPAHLFLGDARANHADMTAKGRGSVPPPGRPWKLSDPRRAAHHRNGRPCVLVVCSRCGVSFWKRQDHARASVRHYCSKTCSGRGASYAY